MKKLIPILCGLLLPIVGFTQLNYSRVKIYATNAELAEIRTLGVTIDHGKHKDNYFFVTELSELEVDILEANSIPYEVLIEDAASYYAEHAYDPIEKTDREDCSGTGGETDFDPETPENFHLGDMGGYYTYEQFLAELDEMHAAYPELITAKAPISDFETWEGRPIHWVRISDNPTVDEDEDEVLYSAIHHAREPMSLSQTIFYMWYLLENYDTSEEVAFLVDNSEFYFVPMINPDGYKYNQTTNPGGGGFHRKNRNPSIGTTNKGVDLNRNYDYHWNEAGTDPSENGDTYAGEMAFSEPETSAIKWFCENHAFKFAFNAHAHGQLLLFPFGWAIGAFADDNDYYQAYSDHQSIFNGYIAQKSSELYPAAGDSDDWMYDGDLDDHDAIFAMTPEVGTAFWPSSAAIVPTCKDMLFPNLVLAHLSHVYGVSTDLEASTVDGETGYFNYQLERLGLEDGDLTVSMTALTGIESLGEENIHTLTLMEIKEDSISYDLVSGIGFGDPIEYVLHTNNGTWTRHDTIRKTYGTGTVVFSDEVADLSNWTGDWDVTNETSYSPTECITDSPYDGTYGNNVNKSIQLSAPISFEGASYARVTFQAKWEIEADYDYVQFMASTDDGSTWEPLCGKYTNTGVSDQGDAEDEPVYDGVQSEWVLEEIDLIDFIGESEVLFRFVLITDLYVQRDGYYFDDFSVYTDAGAVDPSGIEEFSAANVTLYPNPATNYLNIAINAPNDLKMVEVYNEVGQLVYAKTVNGQVQPIQVGHLAAGIYTTKLTTITGNSVTKRFTILAQ